MKMNSIRRISEDYLWPADPRARRKLLFVHGHQSEQVCSSNQYVGKECGIAVLCYDS